MAEGLVLATFAGMLVSGTVLRLPMVGVLLAGFGLFAGYGLWRGYDIRELLGATREGIAAVRGVVALLAVTGALSAAWRASGTIPVIVGWSSHLLRPEACILACFLLCSAMSLLMGTGFGTVATMGVVCMSMAGAMGANRLLVGGAIIAGSYFGDRSSPVSSSAVLVSTITGTRLSQNVRRMLGMSLVPFAVACGVYAALGATFGASRAAVDMSSPLSSVFCLSPVAALPAIAVIVLAALGVRVQWSMLASLGTALACCLTLQGMSPYELPEMLLAGYSCPNPTLAGMLDGGGVLSMANVMAVIVVSSTYVGLFRKTGLLDGACGLVTRLSRSSTPFVGVLATSILACGVTCSQTLAILLTNELCDRSEKDPLALAMDLENSVVIVAPLIPWSVSSVAGLAIIGAPTTSLAAACFLYLVPLWTLVVSLAVHRSPRLVSSAPGRLIGLAPCDVAGVK